MLWRAGAFGTWAAVRVAVRQRSPGHQGGDGRGRPGQCDDQPRGRDFAQRASGCGGQALQRHRSGQQQAERLTALRLGHRVEQPAGQCELVGDAETGHCQHDGGVSRCGVQREPQQRQSERKREWAGQSLLARRAHQAADDQVAGEHPGGDRCEQQTGRVRRADLRGVRDQHALGADHQRRCQPLRQQQRPDRRPAQQRPVHLPGLADAGRTAGAAAWVVGQAQLQQACRGQAGRGGDPERAWRADSGDQHAAGGEAEHLRAAGRHGEHGTAEHVAVAV
jgi:hypothetical protein